MFYVCESWPERTYPRTLSISQAPPPLPLDRLNISQCYFGKRMEWTIKCSHTRTHARARVRALTLISTQNTYIDKHSLETFQMQWEKAADTSFHLLP